MTGLYPRWVQIAQFPTYQNADEQQHRKPDPKRQCLGHAAGFGRLLVCVGSAPFEHEIQGSRQAGKDGRKSDECKGCHAQHYPVRLPLRFALLTAGALLGMALTFSAGRWQLSRAAQKEALAAALQTQAARPSLANADMLGTALAPTLLHRQVRLRGEWLAQHTVFLDNRQMHERTGFYVLTPFKLSGSTATILVQRGWVARNFLDRAALPAIASPAGEQEIHGQMAPPPSALYAFAGAETGAIRQNLDMAAFRAETGLALLPLSVRQTGPAEGPLLRDWPPANLGVEKHYGYAFQWFGLCALIAILYVWFQIVRRFILPRAPRPV